MTRCAHVRSFAATSCLAVVLAASVAGCGGRGAEAGSNTPSTTAATDIDEQLSSIDADLHELDAALDDFDQITATTEGDPS